MDMREPLRWIMKNFESEGYRLCHLAGMIGGSGGFRKALVSRAAHASPSSNKQYGYGLKPSISRLSQTSVIKRDCTYTSL